MSRRDFLKCATAGAMAAAVGTLTAQEALAATAPAPQKGQPVEPQFDTMFSWGRTRPNIVY